MCVHYNVCANPPVEKFWDRLRCGCDCELDLTSFGLVINSYDNDDLVLAELRVCCILHFLV